MTHEPWIVEPCGRSVLVQFEVEGDPVPWRAPGVFRKVAVKPKRVRDWEQFVASEAHKAYGVEPYPGPVEMHLVLIRSNARKKLWGSWWDRRPDMDNLKKAIGDSLTGRAFARGRNGESSGVGRVLADDNQIVQAFVRKVYGDRSRVLITLLRLDPRRQPQPPPTHPHDTQ